MLEVHHYKEKKIRQYMPITYVKMEVCLYTEYRGTSLWYNIIITLYDCVLCTHNRQCIIYIML